MKLCECGCGQPAAIATATNKSRGAVLGQPQRFAHGHNRRTQVKRTSAERWAIAVAARGGQCQKCGSVNKLEFHHRDKHLKITHLVYGWTEQRRQEELAKCDLLCHKCHVKETIKEQGWGLAPHGTTARYRCRFIKCRCTLCRAANAASEKRRYENLA